MRITAEQVSRVHSHISGPAFDSLRTALRNYDFVGNYPELARMGVSMDGLLDFVENNPKAYAMDNLQALSTLGSVITPVQFLQEFLPGFIHIIFRARKIDDLIGMATVGSWEDEQIVQGVTELTGSARPYSDLANVPYASWNTNFIVRTVARFEQGFAVKRLEEARASRIRINTAAEKRNASSVALEISRNAVGFFGYMATTNTTYGFLNDPNLPAYVPVANGASGFPQWSTKTFLEITQDIITWVAALQTNSGDQIDPRKVKLTMAIPNSVDQYLSKLNPLGSQSVREWLAGTYPNIRVVTAPELIGANGGLNAAYLFADKVDDTSTDDGRTFIQMVPTKFMVVGVSQDTKGYEEDFTNATAGVLLKRPWACYRASSI